MAAPTLMSDFNKSSAKIAQLIAKICNGEKMSYKYIETIRERSNGLQVLH